MHKNEIKCMLVDWKSTICLKKNKILEDIMNAFGDKCFALWLHVIDETSQEKTIDEGTTDFLMLWFVELQSFLQMRAN